MTQTPAPQTQQKKCVPSKLMAFLFFLSFAYITKALALVYARSMITQIERRFNIPSKLVGVIDGSFDIGNLLVITFVSYFGAKLHRPRMIAIGCLIMFVGSCVTALPHFIMKRYQYERATVYSLDNTTSHTQLCLANHSNPSVDMDLPEECMTGSSESLMWIFVLVGNILQGIGETPVEPLGVSYLDDFAKVENSPFYIGIIQTLSILGPLLGSLLASYMAQLYVDVGFTNLDEVIITMTDTRWVGAWWMGFLISGGLNLLAAIPFFFIPKTLPKEGEEGLTELRETLRPSINDNNTETVKSNELTLQGFMHFLKKLLKNKVYMLFIIVTVIQFSAYVGLFSFFPKYLEQQYGKSASEAIFLIGVYSLPVIGVGYFLGGYFMKRYKVSTFLAAKIGFLTSVTEYLIFFLAFALLCKNATMAGLTISYDGIEGVSYADNLTVDCNLNCDCPTDVWDPVCGDNGVGFVSACLAGCSSSTGSGQDVVFHNCSCVLSSNSTAILGQCPREEKCNTMLVYFMILNLVCCFIYSLGAMPGYMVLIRSLTPEEKSFGLGLHLLAARALGGIPSPIYYGAAIDTTCIKWGTNSCGHPGACRMYDSDAYSLSQYLLHTSPRMKSHMLARTCGWRCRYLFIGIPSVLRFVSYIPCIFILTALRHTSRSEVVG